MAPRQAIIFIGGDAPHDNAHAFVMSDAAPDAAGWAALAEDVGAGLGEQAASVTAASAPPAASSQWRLCRSGVC